MIEMGSRKERSEKPPGGSRGGGEGKGVAEGRAGKKAANGFPFAAWVSDQISV
jgi:hypothetical protein